MEERSAFRAGFGRWIWFSIFRISGAPSTAVARDSMGQLLHHRSTFGCSGVKNGGEVRSFGEKGFVLRFSDSTRPKVSHPRSCQLVMGALLWDAVGLYIPAPMVLPPVE
ncbi:unnamed protein product [Brassica oleracea var. botrytis]